MGAAGEQIVDRGIEFFDGLDLAERPRWVP
jgi:hypothetical protein